MDIIMTRAEKEKKLKKNCSRFDRRTPLTKNTFVYLIISSSALIAVKSNENAIITAIKVF